MKTLYFWTNYHHKLTPIDQKKKEFSVVKMSFAFPQEKGTYNFGKIRYSNDHYIDRAYV